MTVSVRVEHAGDANGVVLSLPAILGARGVEQKVPLRLNYDEKRQLKESALAKLRNDQIERLLYEAA